MCLYYALFTAVASSSLGGGFLLRGGAWRGWRDGFFSRTRSLTALQRFQLSVLADARKLHNPPTTTTTPLVGFAFYAERERERERWKSGAGRRNVIRNTLWKSFRRWSHVAPTLFLSFSHSLCVSLAYICQSPINCVRTAQQQAENFQEAS